MKKVVITGASTFGVNNMGDDAMLANLVSGIRHAYPDCEITFLARHPDPAYDEAFGFESLQNLDHATKEQSVGRFFWGMNPGDPIDHLVAINQAIAAADLLIIGGNSFMEIASNEFLRGVSSYAATLATLAKFNGTPFALYGLNVVDPIKDPVTIQHARFLCENAVAVTVRESEALELLAEVGVKPVRANVLGDPAYGLGAYPRKKNRALLTRYRELLDPQKLTLGVSFRHQYWSGGAAEYEAAAGQMGAVLDCLIDRYDLQCLAVPNCTYTHANPWQDDRLTHKVLVEQMSRGDRVVEVREQLSVYETLDLFDLLDVHVSNRRHSSVFAAIKAVPFVSINVGVKGQIMPFLSQLGVVDQFCPMSSPDELYQKLVSTIDNRSELSEKLKLTVAPLIAMAPQHTDVILGAI